MATETTRRSALGILATGPIAMLPALSVMSCSERAKAAEISELPAFIAKWRRAEERCLRFGEQVQDPAYEQFTAAAEALPHHRTIHSFQNIRGEITHLNTANTAAVAVAREALAGRIYKSSKPSDGGDYWDTVRELVQADDDRIEQTRKLRTAFRIDEYEKHADKLASHASKALWAAIEYPVSSLDELCLKLDFIEEIEMSSERSDQAIAADVRRLAGRPSSREAAHA